MKSIVVDTCVAAASGERPTSNRSMICRKVLDTIYHEKHIVIMSAPIVNEWNKYQSNYSRKWRVIMSQHGRIKIVNKCMDNNLRSKIAKYASSVNSRKKMLEDCILIEAAIVTDKSIISLDEEVRTYYRAIASAISNIGSILWVNPELSNEQVIRWLEIGAPYETNRLLNFVK